MELLQRLRDPFKVTPQDAAEAADKIERLREALKQIEGAWDKYPEHFEKRGETYALNLLKQIARAARKETE